MWKGRGEGGSRSPRGLEMQLALGNRLRIPGLERRRAMPRVLDLNPVLSPAGSFSLPRALPCVASQQVP